MALKHREQSTLSTNSLVSCNGDYYKHLIVCAFNSRINEIIYKCLTRHCKILSRDYIGYVDYILQYYGN